MGWVGYGCVALEPVGEYGVRRPSAPKPHPTRRVAPTQPSLGTQLYLTRRAARIQRLRRLLLLIIAITIHNFPEGMAVGVAFGAIGRFQYTLYYYTTILLSY